MRGSPILLEQSQASAFEIQWMSSVNPVGPDCLRTSSSDQLRAGNEEALTLSLLGESVDLIGVCFLLGMVEANARVEAALRAGRFPVLYGGDCSVLLGATPALRWAARHKLRREIRVPSIAGRVRLHSAPQVRRDPERIAAQAAADVAAEASGWWPHVDLDVLDVQEFRACGAADDPSMPQGLTWHS